MKTLIKSVSLHGKTVDILIEGNIFKKISEESIPEENIDKIIDGTGKAIEPAFYNTHSHLPMTIFQGINDDKEMMDWLKEDIWPREAKLTPEDIYIATKFGILEMIKGGVVFCNDMYRNPEVIMKAIDEMGIRGVVSNPEIDKMHPELLEQKKKSVLDFIELENINENRIMKAIACHSIYTLSDDFLQFYSDLAKKYNMYIHIMASETKKEVEDCIKANGCTPIEKLEKFGLLTDKTILVYCVHLTDNDINLIKKYNCKISHCPISNFKLKSGLMPYQKLHNEGIMITLGTDSSASNNSLGMLEQMKFSALNAKTQANSSEAGNVHDIYETATENGAKAFNINAGLIEEGKLADFLLYKMKHYLLLPHFNFVSNIVYCAENECITDVFCDGVQLMCDRKVKDEDKIIQDFKELAEKYRGID